MKFSEDVQNLGAEIRKLQEKVITKKSELEKLKVKEFEKQYGLIPEKTIIIHHDGYECLYVSPDGRWAWAWINVRKKYKNHRKDDVFTIYGEWKKK